MLPLHGDRQTSTHNMNTIKPHCKIYNKYKIIEQKSKRYKGTENYEEKN